MSVQPGEQLTKDPNAVLTYQFDWSDWLGDAQIATPTVVVSGADEVLTAGAASLATGNQKVNVTLTGGTVGLVYTVRCRIVTNETPAQTDDRSVSIKIREH